MPKYELEVNRYFYHVLCQKKIKPSLWCLENSETKYTDVYCIIICNQIPYQFAQQNFKNF